METDAGYAGAEQNRKTADCRGQSPKGPGLRQFFLQADAAGKAGPIESRRGNRVFTGISKDIHRKLNYAGGF